MRGSGQRLPITLRFTRVLGTFSHTTCFPFSCALWACFSDRSVSDEHSEPIGALMPHAALWVVQPSLCSSLFSSSLVSMPHAALWVVQPFQLSSKARILPVFQCRTRLCGWCNYDRLLLACENCLFQCRTRLCGWCNPKEGEKLSKDGKVSMPHAALWVVQPSECEKSLPYRSFQCRTRLCGWCNGISFYGI